MKLLLLILTVMTWTVDSKNSVSGEGQWPYDMDVSYSNTYSKGQVRAGDTATLHFVHLEGIDIQQITVYTRSNKNSGAGTFTVESNGQTVATKSGSFDEWTGSFDNENFHPIALLAQPVQDVDELTIRLEGTVNSLHIEKYEISYTAAAPRTVTLRKGNAVYAELTETTKGVGVYLPSLPDTAEWRFIGWCETEIWETHDYPRVYPGNSTFVPNEDCTLWATYRFHEEPLTAYMTDVFSGMFLYVNTESGNALCGVPEGGRMDFARIDLENMNQQYWIEFTSPDTAYITHDLTGTPIGYSGTNLTASHSPWLVYHEGDETLLYMRYNSKTYVLWLDCLDGMGTRYSGLKLADLGHSPMKLQQVPIEGCDPLITCHPENTQDVENVPSGVTREGVLMRFGNYELRLVNGRKELRIKN